MLLEAIEESREVVCRVCIDFNLPLTIFDLYHLRLTQETTVTTHYHST